MVSQSRMVWGDGSRGRALEPVALTADPRSGITVKSCAVRPFGVTVATRIVETGYDFREFSRLRPMLVGPPAE